MLCLGTSAAEMKVCMQELQCSAEDIGAGAGTLLPKPAGSALESVSTSLPAVTADVHENLLLLQPQICSLLNPQRNLGVAAHYNLGSPGTCLLPGAALVLCMGQNNQPSSHSEALVTGPGTDLYIFPHR